MASKTFAIGLVRVTPPLVLALDVGSTASRGSLFDATARPIRPRSKTLHAFTTAADGTSIIDPDQVVDEVTGLITELVDLAGDLPIAGVALDTFASSLVGVDASGAAITPCFNYNDNRCADEVAGLRSRRAPGAASTPATCRPGCAGWPATYRSNGRRSPGGCRSESTCNCDFSATPPQAPRRPPGQDC